MTVYYNHSQSLGYRWDLENRDRLYANGVEWRGFGPRVEIPREVDPRGWLRTENQGPMGSCRGHSGTTGGEFIYKGIVGEVIQFSPMWLYLQTQKRDGLFGRDNGSTIENGVKVMVEEGLCTLDAFPYPNPVRYSTHIPDGAARDAAGYKFGRYSPIRSWQEAIEWIGTGQGYIDIGTRWPLRHSNGLMRYWQPTGNGGHARALCGYIDHPVAGERTLIDFNSHGERSGDHGEFFMTEEAFEGMLRDRYSSVIGVSDMPTAKPREIDFTKTSTIR